MRNMVFARSCTLLRLVCQKTGSTTNLIFRNASANSKPFECISTNVIKNKLPNEIRHLSESITSSSTGYVDKIKKNELVKCNVNNENNNNVTEIWKERAHVTALIEKDAFEYNEALVDVEENSLNPLDSCNEDLSDIGPYMTPTYNFAKFANDSYTIQQLVKLGVNLHKLESDRDVLEMYLSLDFVKDIKPYIRFLHDCGVLSNNLGYFITKNPKIFKEDMDDLHTRIRYLRSHEYTPEMIQRIVNTNPLWLSFQTQEIDRRLGYFQNTFKLSGHQVRYLTVRNPRLITYDMKHIKHNTFAMKEEMGFNKEELKHILLKTPRVWTLARTKIVNTFDFAHNEMNLSHSIMAQQSMILLCRKIRLQQRHTFLVKLGKNQYDPLKPLYVSLIALVSGNDIEFCTNVAKTSIYTFNMFLKTNN